MLNIKTISGRIVIDEKLVLSELALSTTSGRIILGDVTCGTAVLSTVSSGVEVESLKSLATIHSTTGSIRIGSAAGGGEFKTVSGSIDLPYAAVTGDITASSVSGSLRLYLPTTLSFAVDAQNITGSISIPFEGSFTGGKHAVSGTVGNGPQANIHLRSVSGRIDVLPLLK